MGDFESALAEILGSAGKNFPRYSMRHLESGLGPLPSLSCIVGGSVSYKQDLPSSMPSDTEYALATPAHQTPEPVGCLQRV